MHGNPVNYRDPSGEFAFLPALAWLAMTIFGGTVVGATTAIAYDVFANQGMGLGGHNQGNYGAIDWTRARAAAQFGAGLGVEISLNAGLGVLTGGSLSALVKAGKLSTGAAWGLGGLADVGVGTLSDTMLHGDDVADALVNNALFFGAGEVIGAVARQAVRGVSRAARRGGTASDAAWERILASDIDVDGLGRIRVGRSVEGDPGASLRVRRAWPATQWRTGKPPAFRAGIYEYVSQNHPLRRLYIGRSLYLRKRLGEHLLEGDFTDWNEVRYSMIDLDTRSPSYWLGVAERTRMYQLSSGDINRLANINWPVNEEPGILYNLPLPEGWPEDLSLPQDPRFYEMLIPKRR